VDARASEGRPVTAGALLARAWRGVVWWAKGVTGESKYQAYVEHERRVHPDREPMTERDFWRDEYRRQDANPEGRCC